MTSRPPSALPVRAGSEGPATPPRRRTLGHAFTIAVGLVGWFVVIGLPALHAVPHDAPSGPLSIGMFVTVILAARALAFRMEESVLSLDSAYYVAAALCVGTVEAGTLVALALTVDASVRLALVLRHGRDPGGGPDGWWAAVGYILYFGGMSGALLVVSGWVFGADKLVGIHPAPGDAAIHVVLIAGMLLISHYTVQGIRHGLLGHSVRAYLRELAIPSIIAEASLMPIGVVLVLLYDPQQPLGFVLLSATYLLINYVFARLSRTSQLLEERVHDLEILNATARRFSASLQVEELVEAVARETSNAIPECDAVALIHRRAGRDSELVIDSYDRQADKFFRHGMTKGAGAAGWVMQHGTSRVIDDLTTADIATDSAEHGIRSWLGVPLFMYGECEGVIAVQSTRAAAFGPESQRLLEALALQIAAALQNAHLYELAMVDGLTGLYVRRYFDARIEEEVERSRRYKTAFSVIMMDIDDFKKLNDTYGHLVGDRVLRAISNVVKGQMRGVDTATRFGGEELAVILPRTEMVGAYNLAERIREGIAELRITTDDEPPKVLGVTASLGIAAFPESKAQDGTDLVRRADRALYRAKKMGKNRVELF
ncbi:MAG TPA: sensor domain-containing diguanylate cyclase, partial [Kofleriaceae bacterium]|nr:sensor domain-containing diguanylate cyclase [Kofleriaceae bacterium]